jgi:hypothetical protein
LCPRNLVVPQGFPPDIQEPPRPTSTNAFLTVASQSKFRSVSEGTRLGVFVMLIRYKEKLLACDWEAQLCGARAPNGHYNEIFMTNP